MSGTDAATQQRETDSLGALLGGRGGAVDATAPPVAFVIAWLVSDESIGIGVAAAVTIAAATAGWRLRRGARPRAALVGLLGVCVAALIVMALWAIVAAVLAKAGQNALQRATPPAPQTVETVKEDIQWAKNPTGSAPR
jgi:predicted PurR-regulated permease PerM